MMFDTLAPCQIRTLGRWQFSISQFVEALRGSLIGSGEPLGREMDEAVLQALRNRIEQWSPSRDAYDMAWLNLLEVTVCWASDEIRRRDSK